MTLTIFNCRTKETPPDEKLPLYKCPRCMRKVRGIDKYRAHKCEGKKK